ncbi:MAG: DNA recombination protein RmuC, partial [Kiritimatiellae bacterium]|nr:DNA recombination protein RmuC [Kiritimatiellia bacterium]
MSEWIFLFTGLMAGGIAAYLWQRRVAAGERTRQDALLSDAEAQRINAEREKSNAEVMLKAKCNEIEQLRRDGVEGLKRQAEQFREEIQALNGRIDDGDRKIQAEREQKEDLAKRLAAAEETQKASERLFKEREDQYKKTLEQGAAHFKELAQKILEDREQKLKNDATNPLSELVKQLKTDIDNLKTQISSSNEKSATSHVDLVNKITNLVNQTNKVTEQANNLAGAIRGDSRFMGEWGEIQLKRILDMSQM